MTTTPAETRLSGITVAAIDRCFTDVLLTIPEPFIYTERAMMSRPLQFAVDKVGDTIRQLNGGDSQESTRAVVGFLFAHRLVRECVPDYQLWVNDQRELIRRIDVAATIDPNDKDETKAFFPALESRFLHHPEVLDHLLAKFTNHDSRYGAQVLLICLPDFLQIEAATPESV